MCHKKYTVSLITILLFWLTQPAKTQPDADFKKNKDAAVAELRDYSNPDTNRIKALIKICNTATYLKERTDVHPYSLEALELSRKLAFPYGLAYAYSNLGSFYKASTDYTIAHNYYDSALLVTGNTKDLRLEQVRATVFERKGMIFQTQENYYPALNCYFEALKFGEQYSNERASRIYLFITGIYTALNNLDKAMEYAMKNVRLVEKDSTLRVHSVYLPLVDIYLEKNDLINAELYLEKLKPMAMDPMAGQVSFGYYMKRGHVDYKREKYKEAFENYQKGYEFALKGGHNASISFALRFLSKTALKLGNVQAAKSYALTNIDLADEMNAKAGKMEALTNLANYYNKVGDTKTAFSLISQAMALKDSLITESNIKQVNILGAIYETEKQQKQIILLESEKERQASAVKEKSMLNIIFIISIVVLLVLGYLGYMNFRKGQLLAKNERKLQQQRISELEKDKQLLTIDAMLKGQEDERSRIAKDLHDGLGGLLSGTKLSFVNVKEKLALSPDNKVLFDKSLSMLDNTIGDLRKVAQNLMPEALVKFGLHDALRDFCDNIQFSSGVKVVYQQYGEERKLDNTAEVFIFRIIQELVNNVVKHAHARQIIVQLSMMKNKTVITVEDDGRGFEKTLLDSSRGAGMTNIHYRVKYFNGTSDIITSPGNGTSVNIELMA
jgi:two-component system, NarL family, sensor kinase